MTVLVIDGQGGKLGKLLCELISSKCPDCFLTAVGTNTAATASMLKGGAKKAATGENSVVVMSKKADVIIGPVGMIIADSLMGEITERAAIAVAKSDAVKIMIPSDRCGNIVAGTKDIPLSEMAEDAVQKLLDLLSDNNGNRHRFFV